MKTKEMMKLAAAVALVGACENVSATVYRAGFHQGRIWLNYEKKIPSFDQDSYASNAQDWTLSALMCNVTGNAGAKGYSEVTGTEWQWQNYYGYVYDGEMWMEAGTTYIFGGNFDDGSAILIDGKVAWSQGNPGGTGSGYNSWSAPKSHTPTSTGWHTVKLLVYDWEGGKNITCGALSATMWNTNGVTTASPTDSWNKFQDDGSGSLFRAKLTNTYLRVVSARAAAGGYAVTVENLAPQAVEMKIFAGVADLGETEKGWTSESQSVAFGGGETKEIDVSWSGTDTPVYRIFLSGENATLESAKGFWEWSEVHTLGFVPCVSTAVSETTSTSMTVSVTCGYAESLEGAVPDIAVTAYYGPVNGGQDPSAWANSTNYPAMQPGNFTDTFTCAAGTSCSVVFSASIGGGAPVWSDVSTFGASLVNITGPSSVYESDETEKKFVLTRGADDGWQSITVGLAYTYSGDLASDFSGLPASVTFDVGETEREIPFAVIDNDASDLSRDLVVAIAAGDNYIAGTANALTIRVVDDETEAKVCEWTGVGNGSSWSDADNWSSKTVPTQIDTALFGSSVAADSVIVLSEATPAEARLINVTSPSAFTIGEADGPALSAIPFTVGPGSGRVTVNAEFDLAADTTLTVAEGAELDIRRIVGTKDLVLDGDGTVKMVQAGNRTAGKTEVRGGVLLISNSRQLGSQLTIGGYGKPAVARSNRAEVGTNPFGVSNKTIVLDKGVYDLETDGMSGHWEKEQNGPIDISNGGTFLPGKRRVQISTKSVPVLTIAGVISGGVGGVIDMSDSTSLVVPETADAAPVIQPHLTVTTGVKFDIGDIPNFPIDATISGGISYGWHPRDAFWKKGAGVLRLTEKSTYGGGGDLAQGQGTTQIQEGTLLVDNDPTVYGSGTGNSLVRVDGGAVLGGTGRIGGLTETVTHWSGNNGTGANTCVTAKGTAEKQAVVWPGTIDGEDGSHVNGTLTVGVAELHHPVTFGDYATFKASFGAARNDQDALVVNGAVDISQTGTKLVLVPNGAPGNVRGGTYTILSATDGITNSFAEVEKPSGWRVNKVNARQVAVGEGETTVEVYDALTVTMAGRGFAVFIR